MIKEFKQGMKQSFEMTDMGLLKYFLGLENEATPMNCNEKLMLNDEAYKVNEEQFRSLVGGLIYLTHTRSDLAYAVSLITRFMQSPSKIHMGAAKRILRYVANDRKSLSAYLFSLGSGAVAWSSKKHHTVALSSTEAEYISATAATCEAIWLRRILQDLGFEQKESTTIYCDNKSAINLSKNPVMHSRSKHIELKHHFFREMVMQKQVSLEYCSTHSQLADVLTKSLCREKFVYFRYQPGVMEIHLFIATSEIHMKYKLKMSKEQVVEKARSMVAYARSLGCDDVEFSPEDAGRIDLCYVNKSEREFLNEILGEVIKAGATTLNIPDTVGYNWPREFGHLIADIKSNTPGIENVIISTHCQNDLGLSTANTLEGAYNGARQSEVTINGIGERAGNASLEEVVMTLKCKGELLGGLYTGINTRHIVMASKMVEEYSGLQVQPYKAIVGANAFAHESGIHQDGMLKNKSNYEIMSPEDIGLLDLMNLLGFDIDGRELNLFWRFKSVAEMKKVITDDDQIALVSDEVFQPKVVWKFGDVQAVAAAESAVASSQPIISLDAASSESDSEDNHDDDSCSDGTNKGTHSLMKSNGQN
ncbi:hypothetical protein E3N88_14913 [Mikania micrantha]|uniref:Pyruvate carboxyltransferase domain-containing protein n=1 Tax=Mikania micrantha TaxID=192012 RepID=A0A5N6P4R5_9ASTR|nr:hypothetical protein E3N88_14913 [Mikania micrantha]